MKQKQDETLKNLTRKDLLELLLEQNKRIEALSNRLSEVEAELNSRQITIEESGSIAEAALKLNGVFEAAQKACDQYLENVCETGRISQPNRFHTTGPAQARRDINLERKPILNRQPQPAGRVRPAENRTENRIESRIENRAEALPEQRIYTDLLLASPDSGGVSRENRKTSGGTIPRRPRISEEERVRVKRPDLSEILESGGTSAGSIPKRSESRKKSPGFGGWFRDHFGKQKPEQPMQAEEEPVSRIRSGSSYPDNICGVDFTRFPEHIFGEAGGTAYETETKRYR